MSKKKVLILGGYGSFGQYITDVLLADPGMEIIVAGRNAQRGADFAAAKKIDFRQCDARDPISLQSAIEDVLLVINASGPFSTSDYSIPRLCIEHGCHYIDIADGREYVASFSTLDSIARHHNVFACTGASTTPAITSAMVNALGNGPWRSIKVALNAGNKNPAGVSTIATILSYVGKEVRVWQDGVWTRKWGWGDGEFVDFPPPVGRRRVHLCDTPDLEMFPKYFSVQNVIFKAGVELTLFNYAIAGLGMIRRLIPSLDLPALAGPLVAMSTLFKPFGTLHGGCAVWTEDMMGNRRSLALVARENGPRIPGAPAILLARALVHGKIDRIGAFDSTGLLDFTDIVELLAPYNIFAVRGQNDTWEAVP